VPAADNVTAHPFLLNIGLDASGLAGRGPAGLAPSSATRPISVALAHPRAEALPLFHED